MLFIHIIYILLFQYVQFIACQRVQYNILLKYDNRI